MPGTNLTREEAAARAAARHRRSPTTSSSTSPRVRRRSRRAAPSRFTCAEPGAETFLDFIGGSVESVTVNGDRARPGGGTSSTAGSALPGLAADNELVVAPRALHEHRRGPAPLRRPRRRRGLPLQPVRGGRQPADVPGLRAARPQGRVRLHRHRARRTGRSSRNSPTPEPDARRGDGRRDVALRAARRASPATSPRSSPAPTTSCATRSTSRAGDGAARHLLPPQSCAPYLDADELFELTKTGFAFFEEEFDCAYPFAKYDQLFTPEFNAGAMENAGAVTDRRGLRLPLQGHRGARRAPRPDRAPRAGPHVVRQPRDDALVGRPLAQRVVRRVGLDDLPGRGHPLDRRLDDLRHAREGLGLPPGPALLDAPDRRRDRRPGGRRGQLRRHHLRQGRLGPQAARRLRRPRAVPRRHPGLLRHARLGQHHPRRPADRARDRPRAATCARGPSSGSRPPASTRCARSSRSTTAASSPRPRSTRPAPRASRPSARTASRSASTTSTTGVLRLTDRLEVDVDGAAHRAPAAGRPPAARPPPRQRGRPHLRQDPLRRALARHGAGPPARVRVRRCRGPSSSPRRGT